MRKLIVMLSGSVLFLFLGLIYAWSIFVAPLEAEFGWSRAQTSLVFSICMSAFCIGGICAAELRQKVKPSILIILSGILVAIGFYMASKTTALWQLYVYYGVFCGFAVGSAYNVLLSTIPPQFPKQIGLINGLLLMFFGFGSLAFGPMVKAQMDILGWRGLFQGLGLIFLVIFILLSFIQKNPVKVTSSVSAEAEEGMSVGEMLKTSRFWLFFIWEVVIAAVGLSFIGHAASIAKDIQLSGSMIPVAVGIVSAASGMGKLTSGALSDRLNVSKTAFIMSIIGLVGCGVMVLCIQNSSVGLLYGGFALVGFAYGGGPSLNAAFVRKEFGNKNFSWSFSLMSCSLMVASLVGTYLVGVVRSASNDYLSSVLVMALYLVIGIISLILLEKKPAKKEI